MSGRSGTNDPGKKRKHMRFTPDPNTLVWVHPVNQAGEPSGEAFVALAIDESHEGCSVVTRQHPTLSVGQKYVVTVGSLAPTPATAAWIRELEPGILRVGFALQL